MSENFDEEEKKIREGKKDEDIYDSHGREHQEKDEEIDENEAAFMEGYEKDEELSIKKGGKKASDEEAKD